MYFYIKALHVIFVVTWFAGLFYIVRLFVYHTEANEKEEPARSILLQQLSLMIRRLWLVITWPSAILTLVFGVLTWTMLGALPLWLMIKLVFVAGLFAYHLSLHYIYKQQMKQVFRYTSYQLRIWNEVSTIFLFAIVFLAVVKQGMSWLWGLAGLAALIMVLMAAVKIYKNVRQKKRARHQTNTRLSES